jgi:membrane-associated phospholipid phosphatase
VDGAVVQDRAVTGRWSWAETRRVAREALVLGVLWMVYTLGRALAARHIGRAFPNARDVWRLERWAHIPSEARLQHWALQWNPGIHMADLYYKYVHLTDFVLISAWLLIWRPEHFGWFRRCIVFMTFFELVGHFVYPLAPPRMNKQFGIVDTAQLFGNSVYGNDYKNHGLFNQYAAMPSMHVAWSWFFAITVISIAKSKWRFLILFHAVAMTYTVVVTGNHYWLDGIVGLMLMAIALVLFNSDSPWTTARPRRRSVPDAPSAAGCQ